MQLTFPAHVVAVCVCAGICLGRPAAQEAGKPIAPAEPRTSQYEVAHERTAPSISTDPVPGILPYHTIFPQLNGVGEYELPTYVPEHADPPHPAYVRALSQLQMLLQANAVVMPGKGDEGPPCPSCLPRPRVPGGSDPHMPRPRLPGGSDPPTSPGPLPEAPQCEILCPTGTPQASTVRSPLPSTLSPSLAPGH